MLKSSSLCLYSSNLGTFWLKIEQFWPFAEISIFSHGGHLGYRKCPNLNYISIMMSLFNIYYGIFYELWTFAYFDRLCKLEKRFLVMAAILDTGRRWRTQFWKGTTQGSSQQSLVEITTVVSEEKIFFKFHPPFLF
jgi:hypothetical protein